MARYAVEEGAKVVAISTIHGTVYNPEGLDVETLLEARRQLGDRAVEAYEDAEHIERDNIYFLPVDILMPGARPHVIDINNIDRVQAKIIAPGANIPATDEAMEVMLERGTHYIPDFVANIGGTIGPYVGILGGTSEQAFKALKDNVAPLTLEVMETARKEGVTPVAIATRMAREKFLKIREEGKVLTGEEYFELLRKNLKLD
jgi:glutamate dehydrogenase (NAD(P)+)